MESRRRGMQLARQLCDERTPAVDAPPGTAHKEDFVTELAQSPSANSMDEVAVSALYRQLLDAWNRRAAGDFATPFADDGYVVGFDGSQMEGRGEIETVNGVVSRAS
jgi:hypothetical protein